MRLTAIVAAAALITGSAAASARADTSAWTAGQDTGTFATGAASTVDSGYYLLTDFFFLTADAGSAVYTNETVSKFQQGAAYNPTTETFINHALGNTYDDNGGLVADSRDFDAFPFQVGDYFRIYNDMSGGSAYSSSPFEVLASTSAAPEPSTWALMLAGVGLAGFALRSRKRNTLVRA